MKPVEVPKPVAKPVESVPLTQERLQAAWDQLLNQWGGTHPGWAAVLQGHAVRHDKGDLFYIISSNSVFERELRAFQTPMLEMLRTQLQCPELMCRVEIRIDTTQEGVAYQPGEKYETMVKEHPDLAKLRMILPEIDY